MMNVKLGVGFSLWHIGQLVSVATIQYEGHPVDPGNQGNTSIQGLH
jgi:hypothetical protein